MMNWFKGNKEKKEEVTTPKAIQPSSTSNTIKSSPVNPSHAQLDSTKSKPESQKNALTNVIMSSSSGSQQMKQNLFAGMAMKKKTPNKEEGDQKKKDEDNQQQSINVSINSNSTDEQTQPTQKSGFNFIKKDKKIEPPQENDSSQLKEYYSKGLPLKEEEDSSVVGENKFLSDLERNQDQNDENIQQDGGAGGSFSYELENPGDIDPANGLIKQEIEYPSQLLSAQIDEHREYADISNTNHEEHENTINSICNEINQGETKQQYGNIEDYNQIQPPIEIKQDPPSEKKLKLFEKFKKSAPAPTEIGSSQNDFAQNLIKSEEDDSILLNSDRLFESLEKEFSNLKEKMNQIVVQQHSTNTKKNYLDIEIEKLKKKISTIERQQNEAVEKDNFDEAERLEATLREQNELMKNTENEKFVCINKHADLEVSKESLFEKEIELYQKYLNKIELSSDKKRVLRNDFEAKEASKIRQEKNQIEEEKERLKINKTHMDLDIKHLEEEKQQIEDSMEKQTREYKTEESTLQEKQHDLELSIAKIKKELEQKQKEFEGIVSKLTSTTNKINQIKSKFDNQLTRLDQKKRKLDSEIETYRKEEENLNQTIINTNKHENEFHDKIQEFDSSLKGLTEVRTLLSQKRTEFEARRENRSQIFQIFTSNNNALNHFEAQSKKDDSFLEKLKEDMLELDKQISDLNTKRVAAEQKLPVLENEKKNMIQQKKYKNAGQISNDIKDTQTQIDEYIAFIEKLRIKERDINDNITEIEYRKKNSGSIYNSLLENAEISKYHWFVVKEEDLKVLYEHALNEKHYEDCNILENELKNCRTELTNLKNKYKERLEPETHEILAVIENKNDVSVEAGNSDKNEVLQKETEQPESKEQYETNEINEQPEANEQLDLETLINKANALKEEIPLIEANINTLAENNDFDAADELQKTVEQKQKDLELILEMLKSNYGVEL